MKAKIKETCEIVDVYHESQHGQITNIYKENVFVNGRIWTEDELIFLNASEVKEADLKKEFDNYTKDILASDVKFEPFTHLYNCAKHFYELGLNTKIEDEQQRKYI